MKFLILFLFSAILLFTQCKNDFEVNENWTDKTIVYGILNQYDSVNYIKVTKAFLGNEDAYIMAQQSDSLYYKDITVTLEEWQGNTLAHTYTLTKDSILNKDSGIFAFNKNIYYKTTATLDPTAKYKLIIFENGKTITSETNLLEDFLIELPGQVALHSENTKLKIKCTSKPNERIFEPTLKFWYYEITSSDTTKKFLDIKLNEQIAPSSDGNDPIISEIKGDQFLINVSNNISHNSNVIKRIVAKSTFDVYVSAGSDVMYTYMQVNAPATGIVTEKPLFTNITNGIGLFTSRITNSSLGKPIAYTTIDSLSKGQYTKTLKFLTQAETLPLWSSSTGFNFP